MTFLQVVHSRNEQAWLGCTDAAAFSVLYVSAIILPEYQRPVNEEKILTEVLILQHMLSQTTCVVKLIIIFTLLEIMICSQKKYVTNFCSFVYKQAHSQYIALQHMQLIYTEQKTV